MAVIAMGSFGGAEIAYGSDLDVLVAYEGKTASDMEAAEAAAAALFRLCNGSTPAEGIVRIDASLRPEGRQGPLARSLDAFARTTSVGARPGSARPCCAPGRWPATTR